jgi:potassium-dependent mechanosensitive channel
MTAGRIAVAIAMVAFLFLPAAYGQAPVGKPIEAAKTAAPAEATPLSSAAIPVPEIAARATDVTNLLHDLRERLVQTPQIELIRTSLLAVSQQINGELTETNTILQGQPDLDTLQAQQQQWRQAQLRLAAWLKVLTARAVVLSGEMDQLKELKQTWIKTRKAAETAKAPAPMLQQIDQVLDDISSAESPLAAHRSFLLDLQSRVAQEISQCNTALSLISSAQGGAMGGILRRGAAPIWNMDRWARAKEDLPARVDKIRKTIRSDIAHYLTDPSKDMPLHAGLLVVFAALLWLARRHLRLRRPEDRLSASPIGALDRPLAAALLGVLIFASGPYSPAPPTVKALLEFVAFAPLIRLVAPAVDRSTLPEVYALWVLFAIDLIRQTVTGGPMSGQGILVFETLMGMAVLTWSLTRGRIRQSVVRENSSSRTELFRTAAVLILLTLAAGVVAGVIGYLGLARLLTSEVIAGGTLGLTLYAGVRVVTGLVVFVLGVWPLRRLHMVDHHRDLVERRIGRLLVFAAVVVLLGRLLDYLGLLAPTLALAQAILSTNLERGSISISVADVIVFFLTVWIAYLLSAFIRFALREDVYPRIGVQRGASYAISSLLNYIILALGFLVALGMIGVDLTRITVLAGAFGVGIGFGLQSVVNNFVSGLILLFERPIHVGDMVEIDDLVGEVRRIGIRASTVRTLNGADIIVPNADLISKQVTNWTLGDKLRRIDLPVGVNYGATPEEVIQILEKVAEDHPDILKNPKPLALFVGYGDSSINFQLRAWTERFEDWFITRSDLAKGVYRAVLDAGMSFPFPQRDVHVIGDPHVAAPARVSDTSGAVDK